MDAAVEDLAGLDDHDLLAGGVADAVAEARAGARRWARLVEFHRRREAEARARVLSSKDTHGFLLGSFPVQQPGRAGYDTYRN